MPIDSLNLVNAWYTQQIFIWDDGTGEKSASLQKWSKNLKKKLRMKQGAMEEWEVHSTIKGVPWLIYHELFMRNILGREISCVYLGIEPRKSQYGKEGFYENMNVNLSTQMNIFHDLFSTLPIIDSDVFIKYNYLSHDCKNELQVEEKAMKIAKLVNRETISPFFKHNRAMVTKLGGGPFPLSRRWIDEIDSRVDGDEEISFVYPDVFVVCASPLKLDYHEGAKDVVSYHTLLRNLGWITAIYNRLSSIYKTDGTRIRDIMDGLHQGSSLAFSLARAIKLRKPSGPLSHLNKLAELLNDIHLEGIDRNWGSMKYVSVYPQTLIKHFVEQLLAVRRAYADECLLQGKPISPSSRPLCYAYGIQLFPDCEKGLSLLNSFAHISQMIYTKIRYVSREEDFKNLVAMLLKEHNPIQEAHHGAGVPDILIPCEDKKFVVIECKIWRSTNQVYKDLEQIGKYLGPDNNCGFLAYFVPRSKQGPLIPLEIQTKPIGYDSVCSTSDAIVEIEIPEHRMKVPVVLVFWRAPTGRIPEGP